MTRQSGREWAAVLAAASFLALASARVASAQSFNVLVNFDGTNGSYPVSGLAQGLDGDIYGTTFGGGDNGTTCIGLGCGTVFKVTPTGTLTTLYSFCAQANCTDGYGPNGVLVLANDGNFYGTTEYGGANQNKQVCRLDYDNSCGTIFKLTPTGTLTALYSFCSQANCADGAEPFAGLVQGTDGNFYGTTNVGGAASSSPYCDVFGCGTVFKISPAGKLTTLYSFCSDGGKGCSDGDFPASGLVEGLDGNFYGTTPHGGTLGCNTGCGTVFKITPGGDLTTIHTFCAQNSNCPDGSLPAGGLVLASDGNFYGTTFFGGPHDDGTVFRITATGQLTTIYYFECLQGYNRDCPEGASPDATLIQATDGNLYGTTQVGGNGLGTIFGITLSGTLTNLHSFQKFDGQTPTASVVQATTGVLYGVAQFGGPNFCSSDFPGCGTLFSENVGLGPFVMTVPTAAKAGASVRILGNNLSGATGVTFNGVAATFKLFSATEITTTVPEGATTGTVQVITPGGALSSNVPFRVIQ